MAKKPKEKLKNRDFGVSGVSGGPVPYRSPIGPFKGSSLLVHGGSAAWPQAALNYWCKELLVNTKGPPTFSKNNKSSPSSRPTEARSDPVFAVLAIIHPPAGDRSEGVPS